MYNIEDVLWVAKRHNNPKRNYVLVNPLQAKYTPSNPSETLAMFNALGNKVVSSYPGIRLVIGFAETATALGAVVAQCCGDGCIYIHSTREAIEDCVDFLEEHSHASEHLLYSKHMDEWLANTETVLFVDDEVSTGKTMINLITMMRKLWTRITHGTLRKSTRVVSPIPGLI